MQSPRAIEALDSARMTMRARTASGPRHQSSDPQTSSRTGGRPITLCEVGREIVRFTASDLVEREGRLFSHLEEPVSIHSQEREVVGGIVVAHVVLREATVRVDGGVREARARARIDRRARIGGSRT